MNDGAITGHPLWENGLAPYAFHEVAASRWIATRERENSVHPRHQPGDFARLRHFIFTFHDETFECLADHFALDSSGIRTVLSELSEVVSHDGDRE